MLSLDRMHTTKGWRGCAQLRFERPYAQGLFDCAKDVLTCGSKQATGVYTYALLI